MRYIDVHTHMLDRRWLELLKQKGGPRYSVEPLQRPVRKFSAFDRPHEPGINAIDVIREPCQRRHPTP